MKFLKKFEAHEEGMSREEMCDLLCKCGYEMEELEGCSNYELAEMCKNATQDRTETNESESWTREEMCEYLCKCGYSQEELDECPNNELAEMCRVASENSNEKNEAKSEKWIQDAIKKPGSLRKDLKKKEGEKITASEIKDELDKLKSKDKDKDKPGVQGLGKKDLKKFRQLQLAKTLKGLKEHQEQENYMFFANVENICNFCQEILAMDRNEVDKILSDGHGWATDHIATSKDDVEEVRNFLKTHNSNTGRENPKFQSVDPEFVKRFTNFNFPGSHNL
jgi:hypothetical protein